MAGVTIRTQIVASGTVRGGVQIPITRTQIQSQPIVYSSPTKTGVKGDTGEKGDTGDDGYTPVKGVDYFDGLPGVDGREVEIRNSGTYIQWRYVGSVSWTDIVALSTLNGTNGADGREVELTNDGTNIKWRYVGGSWATLVSVASLKGDTGKGFTGGSYSSSTGQVTFTSGDGLGFSTGDLRGTDGVSVPIGGTTGQTLLKNSSTDYDYSWATPPSAPVTSVAGKTGAVTLAKTDVGLGSVDNTADVSKPISTATQSALDDKDKLPLTVTVTTARTTAAKIGTTAGGSYTPAHGDKLNVTFTLGVSVGTPTLNIDGSGAKNIRLADANVSTAFLNTGAVSVTVPLWYDGTYYQMYGSQKNDNTTYAEITDAEITTGTASTARAMSGRRAATIITQANNYTDTGLSSKADSSALTSHTSNTANPHSVTKSQVGLGSVTNDAQLKASDKDIDGTLAANSDTKVASQKAVKTYVDTNTQSAISNLIKMIQW